MPKPYPAEFRRDVVAVARKHEAPLAQIAKDFGVPEATLHNWLKKADIEDGVSPHITDKKQPNSGRRRSGFGYWSRKKRSCSEPLHSSRGNCPLNEIPACPRPCR